MNKEVNKFKYNIIEKKKSIKRFTFSNIQIKKKLVKIIIIIIIQLINNLFIFLIF